MCSASVLAGSDDVHVTTYVVPAHKRARSTCFLLFLGVGVISPYVNYVVHCTCRAPAALCRRSIDGSGRHEWRCADGSRGIAARSRPASLDGRPCWRLPAGDGERMHAWCGAVLARDDRSTLICERERQYIVRAGWSGRLHVDCTHTQVSAR